MKEFIYPNRFMRDFKNLNLDGIYPFFSSNYNLFDFFPYFRDYLFALEIFIDKNGFIIKMTDKNLRMCFILSIHEAYNIHFDGEFWVFEEEDYKKLFEQIKSIIFDYMIGEGEYGKTYLSNE